MSSESSNEPTDGVRGGQLYQRRGPNLNFGRAYNSESMGRSARSPSLNPHYTMFIAFGVMTRLDKIEENQDIVMSMLRSTLAKIGCEDHDDDGEILSKLPSTMQELNEIDKRLQQEQPFRRKMVICHHFSCLNCNYRIYSN